MLKDSSTLEVLKDSPTLEVLKDSPTLEVLKDSPTLEVLEDSFKQKSILKQIPSGINEHSWLAGKWGPLNEDVFPIEDGDIPLLC